VTYICVEIVAVVEPKLPQRRPEAGPVLSTEPDDVSDDREDPVPLQQAARLEVLARGRALLDLPQDLVVDRFDPHQDVEEARLAIEGEEVAVADDVRRPDGREEADRELAGDQLPQEGSPLVLERRRVLVGERDEVDPVGAVQPRDLVGQPRRVAVAPLDPEAVLPAVGAAVGAAARELDDRRPPQPEAPVIVPALDQFPADPPPATGRGPGSAAGRR
jgi:hypothetical protein